MTDLQHFRAIWPILDRRRTIVELSEEAWPDLQQLLRRSRLTARARPRWCIRPGCDVPGSGGAVQVLLADIAVTPLPRNVDSVTGEPERTHLDLAS